MANGASGHPGQPVLPIVRNPEQGNVIIQHQREEETSVKVLLQWI